MIINIRDIKFRKPEPATSTPRGGAHRDRRHEAKNGHFKHKGKSFQEHMNDNR